jgi:nitrous oxidase accessory protein NosD
MQLNKISIGQRYGRIGLALLLGLWAVSATFGSFVSGDSNENGLGGTTIRYVSPAGQDTANSCLNPASPCATLQHAVNNAAPGEEIRLAQGTYSDLVEINGLDQIGYIDISLTIRGGYSPADFTQSYPLTQTTILDAQSLGRGLVITGMVTAVVENLTIQNGDATGQGGAEIGFGCEDAGGGIFVKNASVGLTNNKVQTNTACHGGGIFILNSPAAVVLNNEISQNAAAVYAGGLYINGSNDAAVNNNVVAGEFITAAAYRLWAMLFMKILRQTVAAGFV